MEKNELNTNSKIGYLKSLEPVARNIATQYIVDNLQIVTYCDIRHLVLDLFHEKITFMLVDVTDYANMNEINKFVSDYNLTFYSSHIENDSNTIYHIYKKPSKPEGNSRFVLALSSLYNKSFGFVLTFCLSYGVMFFTVYAIYQLLSNQPVFNNVSMPIPKIGFWLEFFFSIVSLTTSFFSATLLNRHLTLRPFVGYWKYFVFAETKGDAGSLPRVSPSLPRLAMIKEHGGKLIIRGWQVSRTHYTHFESEICELTNQSTTNILRYSGNLFYTFSGSDTSGRNNISGSTILHWEKELDKKHIMQMKGWYAGNKSHIIGNIIYHRISEDEFKRMFEANYCISTQEEMKTNS